MITACLERPAEAGQRVTACPVLLLHDDPPAPAARAPAQHGAMPAPLAELLAADGAEARHRVVAAMLHATGHDWLLYGRLEPAGDQLRPVTLCTAHADPQWASRYCAQRYHEVDPRLAQAACSSLPCSWTLEDLESRAAAAPPRSMLRRFVAELGETGMRSGAMFVLPG
jgi:hypothetical protein